MTLTAGSIAFVGFNADGSDNLAFVALTDIALGEVLFFEDNEWTGSGWADTNESAFSWTATALVPAGTIVRIDNIGSGTTTASTGSITIPVAGRGTNRGIAAADEVIYVYQGSAAAPTFITAIANGGFSASNGLLTNTGLTVGVNALDLSTLDDDADIAIYAGSRAGQASFSDYGALINNSANWIAQDGTGDQSGDGIAPDIPFSSAAFTVSSATPAVNLSVSANAGTEAGQTVITVTATASSAVTGDQSVTLGVSGTNITAGDYTLSNPTITIPSGQTSGSVTFTVVDDALAEGTETALLAISNPSAGVALGSTTTQSVAITDNDAPAGPQVSITAADADAAEASTTVNPGTFTVTRTGDTSAALTVTYTISGTAVNTNDYTRLTGSVVIPAGQASANIVITPVNDATSEGNEIAVLTLVDGAAYELGTNSSATVNIANNPTGSLKKVGGATGTGAEIPAFDPASDRLFVVAGSTVEIYSVSATGALTAAGSLTPSFTPQAGTELIPNSVAVKNGTVAVAYAVRNTSTGAQLPGQVAFFNAADGAFLKSVEVGYLPDMLTFSPDGTKVLTANEGEPNSYGQATSFDPEGSVSIINLADGVANATVQTAGFGTFNSQVDALKAAGVRIFGPNATVAQDLEPEYIAFSGDGGQAYVTLQENNAIAILDIATGTFTDIKPLGLKNHSQPTVTGLETFTFNDLPTLGTTAAGQAIPLGGFSGLHFEGYAANGNLKFITHTDRGPNGEPTGINRPFLLPDFVPEIIRFELSRTTGQLTITERLQLQAAPGDPLSGLPNTALSSNANQPFNDEVPVDLQGTVLPLDPLGADLEGIVVDPKDGTFWMVDEYRPAIYHFNTNGVLIDRFVPIGTAAAAGQPVGTFGTEVLPEVLGQRRQNRGFEAVAFQDGKVYAFVQSPIRNPSTLSNGTLNGLQNIRIVEFDPATKVTRQFLYIMDNPASVSATDTRADKIGDAVAIGNGEFLVVERDDDAIDSDPLGEIQKKIYRFSLGEATDLSSLPSSINGKTVDQMTLAELQAAGVKPINKTLHVDLATAGYNTVEKLEGLTLVDRNTLAVINDNDFTVAGITIDPTTGTFTPDPNAEKPVLGLITLQHNGIDASDRDVNGTSGGGGKVNIQNWPVFGMYQPDAIASYTVNGQTYYITANEGDARDYAGFSEEIRVGDAGYDLDNATFPSETTLKQPANLGRLTVTKASGDTNGDGDFDRIQAFGARSFSIWDSSGKQVFDSGDQLEQITAAQVPSLYNSDGSFTAINFDTRSDNKGPEPEGVVVGVVNDRVYAFIGLERTGDVVVYEVTNPTKPQFVEYINTPEDVGPEGLTFISAADSPTGKPLLVTANEISQTVAVFEFTPPVRISDIQGTGHISAFNGQGVRNVQGIVTAIAANGFYIQDPNPDNNNATSEGIFVFTGTSASGLAIRNARQVGESVLVSGTVSEFRPGNNANNLTVTQIGSSNSVQPLSVAAWTTALTGTITPTTLGNGGRAIPNQVINNDFASSGNVETAGDFDPVHEGIDFFESLEGMVVQVNNPVTTSPTNTFGTSQEIWVLADNGANATSRTARGGSLITPTDFNPERIQIDDLNNSLVLPSVNVGAQLGSITGVVSYDFNNYEVLVSAAPSVAQDSPLQKEVTALTGSATQLTVATFNVENLDPSDGTAKFNALAAAIVNNLKSPDIINLEEIQDNNGATNDSVVDASVTFQTLISAISAAGGPTYEYRQINPSDDQDGGEPGGNIRVGFLFNPNRVGFVEGSLQRLTDPTPGEADAFPGDDFASSRKPLVGTFTFNGQQVTVIGNHFNSKGGDQPLFGPNQPPALNSENQRNQQATIVRNYVQGLLSANPYANVLVAGDLNDFEFSNPLTILEGAGLTTLIETLPENERYTYNFEGNAQVLDHILASKNLTSRLDGFDVVHLNSEFADQISDHDPVLAQFTLEAGITLNGGNGRDTLNGKGGDDTLKGGNGEDTLNGGNAGNDKLYGENGNDLLIGGRGDDTLDGGRGDDVLVGGFGHDILTGGQGVDRFDLATSAGTDTITDFAQTIDRIGLTGGLSFADLSFNGERILAGTETLAILTGVNTATLTQADFVTLA